MKSLFVNIILILSIFGSLNLSAQSEAYLALVDSAQTAIATDNLDKAEYFLRRAIATEPSSPGNILLMSNLGMVKFRNGKIEEALDLLGQAHRMAPRAVVVLSNRAQVYAAVGRYDEAYSDFCRIIELDSLNTIARFNRGMLALDRGSKAEAETDFELLRVLEPDSRNCSLAMASLCLATGRYADAIPWFDNLIQGYPDAQYYFHRAYCLMMNERLSEAAADIAEAMVLDPGNPDLYDLRASLHRLYYRNNEAEADEALARRLRKQHAK